MSVRRLLIVSIIVILSSGIAPDSSASVKESALAGKWYPSSAGELSKQIDTLLEKAVVSKNCGRPVMLILPHAGYRYSGNTAAAGFRTIGAPDKSSIDPNLIVLLGPSHYKAFRGCSIISVDYFKTPLGRVKLSRRIAQRLLSDTLFKEYPSAFEQEHSIEILLPFLQRIFGDRLSGDIQILPILVGELDNGDAERSASTIISALAGSRPLFIISSDFTHYGPDFGYMPFSNVGGETALKLKELDNGAINFILKKDIAGFSDYIEKTGITICGRNPIKIALAMPLAGFRAERVSYDTSGSATGDYTNSVSYASIVYCGAVRGIEEYGKNPHSLTADDKRFLLKAARDNIVSWLDRGRGIRFFPAAIPPGCMVKRGAFVTLKNSGGLRGCIGNIFGDRPLIQIVLDCSYNAAFKDPRFKPLRPEELKRTVIEISLLTVPARVISVEEILIGRDGLIIERGMHRGLLLPPVAVEQRWDRDTLLSQACLKAGLPPHAWKERSTTIYRFQAVVFSEEDTR